MWRETTYNIDRLIRAANMFDLIPESEFSGGNGRNVDAQLLAAVQEAKCVFRRLAESRDKAMIFNSLGRVGTWTLKERIRERATIVTNEIGEQIPCIEKIADSAVNCRNRYVHGTKTRVDYEKHMELVVFFTDTLEFLFGVSDLIEMGMGD